jgi:hypothetical protein
LEPPIVGLRGARDWRLRVEPLPQCATRWQDPGLTSSDLTKLARDTKTLLKSTPHLQGLRTSHAAELFNNSLLTPPHHFIFAHGRTRAHHDVISSPPPILCQHLWRFYSANIARCKSLWHDNTMPVSPPLTSIIAQPLGTSRMRMPYVWSL